VTSDWDDDHEAAVAQFPADVRDAHEHSADHRAEIVGSAVCGCFYCCATFAPKAIKAWVDESAEEGGQGRTALCPKCGIDSVIGDQSGFPISRDFLAKMRRHWFGNAEVTG
jgi:hypothetical protein